MKVSTKRLSALLLCIAIIVSLFTVFSTISVNAASSSAEDNVIIDMRSQSLFEASGAKFYYHTANPDTHGKYEFSYDKQALKLNYLEHDGQKPYRVMFHTNADGGKVTDEHKYVVVAYQAKTTKSYTMTIFNTPKVGVEAVIVKDGKDTGGKWLFTDPVDISLASDKGSILSRWVAGNLNTLNIDSSDKDAEFYIKEVVFFRSEADAKAYCASADLDKQVELGDSKTDSGSANGTTTVEDVKPVIMDLSSGLMMSINAEFKDFDGNTEGEYAFVTLPDGSKGLQLKYSPCDSITEHYRTMPAFQNKNMVTDAHKYLRITYMTTNPTTASIKLMNNGSKATQVIVDNTSVSGGNWVRSEAVEIASTSMLSRYVSGMHCTIMYTGESDGAEIYIKELAFFASREQAYEYYGDVPAEDVVSFNSMTFGLGGNGVIVSGNNYGVNAINNDTGAVDITYADSTNYNPHYMAKLKVSDRLIIHPEYKYARVLYSAKHPEGIESARMFIVCDGSPTLQPVLQSSVRDTNGEFVLTSEVCELPDYAMQRLSGTGKFDKPMHVSFCMDTANAGGEYSIKAVYFFTTKEAAEAFTLEDAVGGKKTVSINGNDISKYTVVVDDEAPTIVKGAVDLFVGHIKKLTGVELKVADDTTAETANEILIGQSDRTLSTSVMKQYDGKSDAYRTYYVGVEGTKLVITANEAYAVREAAERLLSNYLYRDVNTVPDTIILSADLKFSSLGSLVIKQDPEFDFELAKNVETPIVFTEDFDVDNGYFIEANGADNWTYSGGEYKANAGADRVVSHIHVYESNVDYTATLKYTAAGANGDMGLMLRYVADDAYLKAGYDFAEGEWYIEYREGADFYIHRTASAKATLTPGTAYTLNFAANGETATLSVNGVPTLTAYTDHVTAGRIAIFAEDSSVSVDNITAVLLSGQGTILKDVSYTKLQSDGILEGGTVLEMADKSLMYIKNNNHFKSLDDGKTWTPIDNYFKLPSYPQIIRLNNGDLLQIIAESGQIYSQTSGDDGKTWVRGGTICSVTKLENLTVKAVNMNDKVMQAPGSGKLLYGQNYEDTNGVDGRNVFCAFYYSDDLGKTWHKSDTETFEMGGNEKQANFGEAKLIECADGTIRMYESWNDHGCIVYSESTDGGKTFGPIVKMTGFKCARSSMAICHDPYGETEYTYYMVWCYSDTSEVNPIMGRSRLALAKTTDGKNWSYIGDLWRWDGAYNHHGSKAQLNHLIDPFVSVSENKIIAGSGLSEYLNPIDPIPYATVHNYPEQHIWAIDRDSLPDGKPMNKFTDVEAGAEYYDAVTYVTDKGLFTGTSETTFAPNDVMTRSMFVTVLGRVEGIDQTKYTKVSFNDVTAGSWYAAYVEWAASEGIVNGTGDGNYGILGNITVEQACTILARYNGFKSGNASGKTTADFSDGATVSSWAKEGVDWAVANGIYAGQNGSLKPQAAASRALVAMIFANYASVYGE